ncbi:pyridoxine kinase, partial [Phenoliferia sp. Uapishka_3]
MVQVNITQEKRVLSIQSHVVSGFVGNKSATFPMQLLGWDVDNANTVEFSNHTANLSFIGLHGLISGYGRWGGSKFDAAHLEDIFSALDVSALSVPPSSIVTYPLSSQANGLLRQSHLLTGYVPGAEALLVVSRTVDRLRSINPSLTYVLDPVMGDDGRIYVSESVIPIYKSLMTKANCATPNYFEAELLTDVKILDDASLRLALRTFHERYNIPHVIISAVSIPTSSLASLGVLPQGATSARMLLCAGSSITSLPGQPLATTTFGIPFPELNEHYEGVGDVFSSLVLARFPGTTPSLADHTISPLAQTAELAIGSLQGILEHTREHALMLAKGRPEVIVMKEGEGAEERVRRLRMVELRMVQSQREILDPVLKYRAVQF